MKHSESPRLLQLKSYQLVYSKKLNLEPGYSAVKLSESFIRKIIKLRQRLPTYAGRFRTTKTSRARLFRDCVILKTSLLVSSGENYI